MKKVDRLRWIEQTFGPEFVLPYRACRAWPEVQTTIDEFWLASRRPSLRTDWRAGSERGFNLPFVHPVNLLQAYNLWQEWGERLVYIIYEGVTPERTICNVLAERIGPTTFLVEWDAGGCAQRAWEHACMPLWHAWVEALDDSDMCVRGRDLPARGWTKFVRPRHLPAHTAFERIVDRLVVLPADADPQTVYTVRDDGRIVIW